MRHLAVAILLAACAAGEPAASGPDAGAGPDAAAPPRPPSATECAEDHHACGTTCVPQQPNDPSVGCAFGCGTPCPAPDGAVATCTAAGTCDLACPPGLAQVDGACVAAACEQRGYTCGTLVDDSGAQFACGSCTGAAACGPDHQCAIGPDAAEDNDSLAQAADLGDLDDADDPSLWRDDLSIDAAADEDWFRFHLTDGFDGGNPAASVELSDRTSALGWLASRHELTMWFACDSADAGSVVRCGEWFTQAAQNTLVDPQLGIGCTVDATYVVWAELAPSCSGLTDSGTVTIRVRKRTPPRGDLYDLRVAVD